MMDLLILLRIKIEYFFEIENDCDESKCKLLSYRIYFKRNHESYIDVVGYLSSFSYMYRIIVLRILVSPMTKL